LCSRFVLRLQSSPEYRVIALFLDPSGDRTAHPNDQVCEVSSETAQKTLKDTSQSPLMVEQDSHCYAFGRFRLKTAERVLLREGEPVPLTPKVFDILLALVENRGRIVEKDDLM